MRKALWPLSCMGLAACSLVVLIEAKEAEKPVVRGTYKKRAA
jgi:hypothetical protein